MIVIQQYNKECIPSIEYHKYKEYQKKITKVQPGLLKNFQRRQLCNYCPNRKVDHTEHQPKLTRESAFKLFWELLLKILQRRIIGKVKNYNL